MKDNYTHVTFILDRSGSMSSIRDDVVGGFNTFIDEQKRVPGECTLTLVQFDSQNAYEVLRSFQPVSSVEHLGADYSPRGSTPLYDAIGLGIVSTGETLGALPDGQRPSKVIFVILTDGLENASREYGRAKVAAMTKEQQEKYNWQFVYLGANQDAMAEGGAMGIARGTSADYSQAKAADAIKMSSAKLASYRTGGSTSMDFAPAEREQLK